MRTVYCIFILLACAYMPVPAQNKTVDSLERVLKKSKDDTAKVRLLNIIAYRLRGIEPEKMQQYAYEARRLSEKLGYTYGLAGAYNMLGLVHYHKAAYRQALLDYNRSLDLYKSIDNKPGIANLLGNIGNAYWDMGDYDSAVYYQLRALAIEEQSGNKDGMADCYANLCLIYQDKGDLVTALEYNLKFFTIAEQLGDKSGIADACNNYGNIYYLKQDYDKAIAYHFKCIALKKELGDKRGLANSLNNIANAYTQQQKLDEAFRHYAQALAYLTELGDIRGMTVCNDNMGGVRYFQKRYAEALRHFFRSKELAESSGNKLSLASSLINISAVEMEMHRYRDAVRYAMEGLVVAREMGAKDRVRDAYRNLTDIYSRMGDYRRAFENYEYYVALKDSILNEANQHSLNELSIKYETEKKENENELLKKDMQLAAANLQRQKSRNLLLIISSLSVFFIGGSTFYFYRKRKNYRFRQQLTAVQQEALNAQMNDHFIGNTMDSINGFIEANDKEKASEYLLLFSRLIRKVLENSVKRLVPVEEDLGIVEDYIRLARLRFTIAPLQHELIIGPGINTKNTLIPPMIFQTLTENAIVHGLNKEKGGKIILKIEKQDNLLVCSVQDNGSGRKAQVPSGAGRESFGSRLAERIVRLNGKDADYVITDLTNPSGTLVTFRVPFLTA